MTESLPSFNYSIHCDSIARILLIGDTGSGKSTFINYLHNYFYNGDLNHLRIAIPCKYHPIQTEQCAHDEININDNTQSKTNSCIQYTFIDSKTNRQYLFLDTPGLSDTRGKEQKLINMTKIIDAITQLGCLTAVIIVLNGSISRLTYSLRGILASLNENIPDSVLKNVIVVLTNTKKHESSFDLNILNLHGKVYPFYMQNNALVSDSHTWTQSIRDNLQIDWNHSMKQIELILQTIDLLKPSSINDFIQMTEIRNNIRSIIHEVRLQLIRIYTIQEQLLQFDLNIRINHQNTIQVHTIEKIDLVDAPFHNTLCINCNQVCHNNCQLNEIKTTNSQVPSQCLIMNNGKCKECRNHCLSVNHYYAKKTIQITYTKLKDILIELKRKFEKINVNQNTYQEMNINRSEIKILLDKALDDKINQLKIKTMKLCEVCSSFNLVHELKFLIKQLTKEVEQFEDSDTKRKNEHVIQSLKRLIRDVENNQRQYREEGPSMQIIEKTSVKDKSINIKLLPTVDLLELHNKPTNHTSADSILEELYRRIQGKSAGPLSTPKEVIMTSRYHNKYKDYSVHDLTYASRKLQARINDILNSNIFKIIDVDPELLIENFMLQTILDEKEKTESINHQNVSIERSVDYSVRSTNYSVPTPIYPPPYPTNELSSLSSMRSSNSNTHSRPIGLSHILHAPYPSSSESSLIPDLPMAHQPMNRTYNQQSQLCYPLSDYQYSRSASENSISSGDQQNFVQMPTPPKDQQRSANLNRFIFNFTPSNSVESQDKMPSCDLSPRPDVVPSKNNLFNSPLMKRHDQIPDLDYERFRRLDNSRLLLMYINAGVDNNEVERVAILQELKQRCYGEHPMLMEANKSLVQERLLANNMKTLKQLLDDQEAVHQEIGKCLKDDDILLINDIPKELIIEANVLNQLILSKGTV